MNKRRKCGKANCRCAQGLLHESPALSVSVDGRSVTISLDSGPRADGPGHIGPLPEGQGRPGQSGQRRGRDAAQEPQTVDVGWSSALAWTRPGFTAGVLNSLCEVLTELTSRTIVHDHIKQRTTAVIVIALLVVLDYLEYVRTFPTNASTPAMIRTAWAYRSSPGRCVPLTSPRREPSTGSDHCSMATSYFRCDG